MNYDVKEALASAILLIHQLDLMCDHSVGICACDDRLRLAYIENTLRELQDEKPLCFVCGKPELEPNDSCPEAARYGGANHATSESMREYLEWSKEP